MSLYVINGLTVKDFVEDGDAFNGCIEEQFSSLDVNGHGVLSRSQLRKALENLADLAAGAGSAADGDIDDFVFEKFDTDGNGTIDKEEFRREMKEIMLAVARGIGDSPIQIALDHGGFLTKAAQRESAKRM